jgi:hypothetical protein
MTLYNKNEAADLTSREKKVLKVALEAELASRQSKHFRAKSRRRR